MDRYPDYQQQRGGGSNNNPNESNNNYNNRSSSSRRSRSRSPMRDKHKSAGRQFYDSSQSQVRHNNSPGFQHQHRGFQNNVISSANLCYI